MTQRSAAKRKLSVFYAIIWILSVSTKWPPEGCLHSNCFTPLSISVTVELSQTGGRSLCNVGSGLHEIPQSSVMSARCWLARVSKCCGRGLRVPNGVIEHPQFPRYFFKIADTAFVLGACDGLMQTRPTGVREISAVPIHTDADSVWFGPLNTHEREGTIKPLAKLFTTLVGLCARPAASATAQAAPEPPKQLRLDDVGGDA